MDNDFKKELVALAAKFEMNIYLSCQYCGRSHESLDNEECFFVTFVRPELPDDKTEDQ